MHQNSQPVNWEWSRTPHTIIAAIYSSTRRLLDILIGLLGCLCLIPILPILWVVNRFFSPGPLFYTQTRVGLHGSPFKIVKLRSMIVDAEAMGVQWTVACDPRITPIGHFLRRSHLDEVPQCWNILKGEMTLIGPRPERPEFVIQLVELIDGYDKRHQVKPGLTGWAQVNYGYGNSIKDAQFKLAYDLEYIDGQSLTLDLKILLRTCAVIWKGQSI